MARSLLYFTALLSLLCCGSGSVSAQTPPFRFEFTAKPGLYSVGLKVVEQFDPSRSFHVAASSPNRIATDGPRPLQTLLWYPAEKSSQATMTFGDYGVLIKTETSFGKSFESGEPQSFIEAFMHGTTDLHAWAMRDAPMRPGHFPVLIYAPSVNAPATENIELCEYLASQGFVVIAVRAWELLLAQ